MVTRRQLIAAGGAAALHSLMPRPAEAAGACGRRLGYRIFGNPDGPPVFYFHGTPGSRLEAALIQCEARAAGVRLIAVDRPGMGRSAYQSCRRILDWPCDVERLAECLGLGGQRFGIVGLSGGAPYAASCAICIPERLTHVAIVSGYAPLGAPGVCPGNQDELIELVAKRPRLAKGFFGLIGKRLDKRPDKVVQRVTKGWTAADKRMVLCNPVHYRQLVANLNAATACGPQGIVTDIRLLAGCWGFDVSSICGVPVSIWQGCCDRIATPSMGRYFHERIAGSELHLDPDGGHVTTLKCNAVQILSRAAAG
ncbi:MAG: alpha/beta hydrolase [Planctomycetota bacterium]